MHQVGLELTKLAANVAKITILAVSLVNIAILAASMAALFRHYQLGVILAALFRQYQGNQRALSISRKIKSEKHVRTSRILKMKLNTKKSKAA